MKTILKTTTLAVLLFAIAYTNYKIGYNAGYKEPPYFVSQATEKDSSIYECRLQDHNGYEFVLELPLNKFYAMNIDVNEIILKSNE